MERKKIVKKYKNLNLKISKNCNINRVPCSINYNGKSNNDKFFYKTISKDEKFINSKIRGRPLIGNIIKLDDKNLTGVILDKNNKTNTIETKFTFDQFTNWCLDSNPDQDLNFKGSLEYFNISKHIHEPITKL